VELTLKFEKIVPVIMKKSLGSYLRMSLGEKNAQLVEMMKRPIRG
jgi:hypothetical protein